MSPAHGDTALQRSLGTLIPLGGLGAGAGMRAGTGAGTGIGTKRIFPGCRRPIAAARARPRGAAAVGHAGSCSSLSASRRSKRTQANYNAQQPLGPRHAVPGRAYDPHRAPRGLEGEAGPGARGAAPAQSAAS